jgi:hypothetical protein
MEPSTHPKLGTLPIELKRFLNPRSAGAHLLLRRSNLTHYFCLGREEPSAADDLPPPENCTTVNCSPPRSYLTRQMLAIIKCTHSLGYIQARGIARHQREFEALRP